MPAVRQIQYHASDGEPGRISDEHPLYDPQQCVFHHTVADSPRPEAGDRRLHPAGDHAFLGAGRQQLWTGQYFLRQSLLSAGPDHKRQAGFLSGTAKERAA